MAVDRQALAQQYLQLLQSGVPAAEAFKKVYPNGIPTAAQQQAIDAKAKQGSALAATGGTVAGLLGIKYGTNLLDKIGSNEAGKKVINQGTQELAKQGGEQVLNQEGSQAGQLMGPETPSIANGELAGPPPLEMGATPFYVPAAAAIGTYLAGKSAINTINGEPEDKSAQGHAGRLQLAITSGGTSEIARALGIFQPSTRTIAKQHTKQLMGASSDSAYQQYVQGMRQQYNAAPTDPSKPFAGKYRTFDEYKSAGLDPKDLTGVYGNIKTFGPDWAHLSQDQREQVTQGLIGANLYDSHKGEVVITDPEKAKQIYSTIVKAPTGVARAPAPQQQQQAVVANTGKPTAYQKKTLAQTGQFGNQLLQVLNK